MDIQVKIIGILLILLAMLHLLFPKYFNWREELSSLRIINRQMMYVHTFFIGLIVFLMGLLCLVLSKDLLTTSLGKQISLGIAVFWIARLCIQFFGYSSKLWKGKPFETTIHILFSILWVYLSLVFILIYLS
jgi:hypothetical protein